MEGQNDAIMFKFNIHIYVYMTTKDYFTEPFKDRRALKDAPNF